MSDEEATAGLWCLQERGKHKDRKYLKQGEAVQRSRFPHSLSWPALVLGFLPVFSVALVPWWCCVQGESGFLFDLHESRA